MAEGGYDMISSATAFEEAKHYIPGGVNSPVRAFGQIGIHPPFMHRGKGSRMVDIEGKEYIDFIGSWGALILGHGDQRVITALREQMENAISFGAPTLLEVQMARLITELVPSVEMVRMVNSGTEATMSALRLARGYTGRKKIVKFVGNYHGHQDSLLVEAGSGALTHGVPSSAGITEDAVLSTMVMEYNHMESLEQLFKREGDSIAAVILEPVVGNMGVVPATQAFMQGVRKLTQNYGALLILDEVMTGFRLALGGAQSLYDVDPDITCFGKIMGGGLPVGAYGGKRAIMEMVSPLGPVYQAGTLSGNPMTMAAGFTTLQILKQNPHIYLQLEERGKRLQNAVDQYILEYKIPAVTSRVGSMFTLFFSQNQVCNGADAKRCNTELYKIYFRFMLEQGTYLPPSQFEAWFISAAHTEEDMELTIKACRKAFQQIIVDQQKGTLHI